MAIYKANVVAEPAPDAQGVFRQLEGAGPGIVSAGALDANKSLPRLEILCGDCGTLLIEGYEGATPMLEQLGEHFATVIYQCWQCRKFNNISSLVPLV